jgi:hypothetical protein
MDLDHGKTAHGIEPDLDTGDRRNSMASCRRRRAGRTGEFAIVAARLLLHQQRR